MPVRPRNNASPIPPHAIGFIIFTSSNDSVFSSKSVRGGSRSLCDALFGQKSSNAAIQLRRLVGYVAGQLLGQFSIAAVSQLLRIAGNRGERGAELQRHLSRDFAVQFLLA